MPAQPTKVDRAPKNRWSAPERATRGHARPRRDDQQSQNAVLPAPQTFPTVDAPRGFAELGVPANLVAAMDAEGISKPFPIQAATIPDALAGRDVLGRGRTGSGKTLAFGLPMISRLARPSGSAKAPPRGLVLVPTRELAMQVADVLARLGRGAGLSLVLVAGGMPYAPQTQAFSRGVDIVVATPGRLIDLMEQGIADLSRIEITVLDEADHMADLGFLPAVTQILDTVPDRGQRLLFSATLDRAVDRLVRIYLHEPVAGEHRAGGVSGEPSPGQHRPQHKAALTAEIASRAGRTLIFVRTQPARTGQR
jgi:superfamily II DNA/RNA helicase